MAAKSVGRLRFRYLAEFDFRHNTRVKLDVNDEQRADTAIKGMAGAGDLFSWPFLDPVAALCNGDDPDWRGCICGVEARYVGLVIGEILIDPPERVLG